MVLTNWGVIFETEHRKAIRKVIYFVVDLIICIAKYIQFFAVCVCVCVCVLHFNLGYCIIFRLICDFFGCEAFSFSI